MDFVMGLPKTRSKNSGIWVIVDTLTKSMRFIIMEYTWTLDQLACAYLNEIVHLHWVPSSIVSDQDTRFQVGFWYKLQESFRTKLIVGTTFHPLWMVRLSVLSRQ